MDQPAECIGGEFLMADNGSAILTDYLITSTELTSVADAIRAKSGTSEPLAWPDGYTAAVDAIQTGGVGFDMSVEPNQWKLLVDVPDRDRVIYIAFLQSVANSATIDWGDGTVEISGDTVGKDIHGINRESHVYSNSGLHVITITDVFGGVTLWGQYAPGSHILSWNPSDIPIGNNQNVAANARAYKQRRLKELSIGESVKIGTAALLNLPTTYNTLRFTQDGEMIKGGMTQIRIYELIIPDGVSVVPAYGIGLEYLETITFPESIRTLEENAVRGCTGCVVFDFTNITLIDGEFPIVCNNSTTFPVLTGTKAKILFANQEIAEKAKAATNWANYASFIHYIGEESS